MNGTLQALYGGVRKQAAASAPGAGGAAAPPAEARPRGAVGSAPVADASAGRSGSLGASGEAAAETLDAVGGLGAGAALEPAAFAAPDVVAAAARRALAAERARCQGPGSGPAPGGLLQGVAGDGNERGRAAQQHGVGIARRPEGGGPAGAVAGVPAEPGHEAGAPIGPAAAVAGRAGSAGEGGKGRARSATAAGLPRDRSAPRCFAGPAGRARRQQQDGPLQSRTDVALICKMACMHVTGLMGHLGACL